MTYAVSLRDVSCTFKSGSKLVHAVSNISLNINQGEFFTLLGPSGSGKTTCLRMIGGFTLPTSGLISIEGEDVSLKHRMQGRSIPSSKTTPCSRT